MPLFNGSMVTKRLGNIIYTLRKTLKNGQRFYPPGYFDCTTDIEKKVQ